jgi:hypothetical protein
MRSRSGILLRSVLIGAAIIGLGGCVAYPADPYYGYGYPAYYGPPVAGTVWIGGSHWRGGGWHDHDHWR